MDLPAVTSVLRRAIRHNKVLGLANPGHAEHGAVLAAIQAAYAPQAVALRPAWTAAARGAAGDQAGTEKQPPAEPRNMLINPSKLTKTGGSILEADRGQFWTPIDRQPARAMQRSRPLRSNSSRGIAERIRRAIATLKPDLMRPVSVREAHPVVFCQLEPAACVRIGHDLSAWYAVGIELVVPC